MKKVSRKISILTMALGCAIGVTARSNNAVDELFNLLDKGGCDSSSLTGSVWTISTDPVNAHGELVLGDTLEFDLIGIASGVTRKGAIQVTRNGLIWPSEDGWNGECTTNGTITQFIVSGDVDVEGCLHDIAFGRLDHGDSLSDKIEIAFQDSGSAESGGCEESSYLHPDHAHGDGG